MTEGVDSLRWDPRVERMIALSRGAHRGVDQRDDIDYWDRLGQRDAYAFAAALVLARGVDSNAFAMSERITGALSEGVTEVGELRDAALDARHRAADPDVALTWLGPRQFHQQYRAMPGIDHDYGMRWGSNGDQRVSLRHLVAVDCGLLYVYDPTWDEYAVLFRDIPVAAVEAAFTRAVQTDIHMSPQSFAAIVAQQPAAPAQLGHPVERVMEP